MALVAPGTGAQSTDPGDRSEPTTLAVIGDFGAFNTPAERVADLVARWSPDHVVTVGDNLYSPPPEYTGTDMFDLTVGQYYCEFLSGAAAGRYCPSGGDSPVNRFFAATGNHDYSDAGVDVYTDYFSLPGQGTTSTTETGSDLFYDVVLGPVHLFVIDTEGALRDEEFLAEQRRWLERAVRGSDAAWKVVAMHDPPYSSGSESGSAVEFQWPFALWGVDVVLAGHEHSYERVLRNGITYVVNGLGGASRYAFSETPVGGSVSRFNDNEGAIRLTATTESLLIEMIDVDDRIVDRYEVPAVEVPEVVAFQDEVSPVPAYRGTRDTTIWEHDPERSVGSAPQLSVDGDDPPYTDDDVYALISWDLHPVPPGSTVVGAWITVDVIRPADEAYEVYPVRRTWDEELATWNRAEDGAAWAEPGASGPADRGTQPIGRLEATESGPASVSLDPDGVEVVQGWVDGAAPAAGVAIASPENVRGIELSSREADEPSSRPRLDVMYRPPPGPYVRPGSRLLAATPGAAFSTTLEAAGGTPPYRWEVEPGALPEGFELTPAGELDADVAPGGTTSFDVVVSDGSDTSQPTRVTVTDGRDAQDGGIEQGAGTDVDDGSEVALFRGAAIDYLVPAGIAVGLIGWVVLRRRSRSEATDEHAELIDHR